MSSESSNQSLFSLSVLSGRSLDLIRQSSTIVRERKVTCWTPVMIGNSNFPTVVNKVVHSYKTGDMLHSKEYLKVSPNLYGGVILDLPQFNIQEYLERRLAAVHLQEDEYLSAYLEQQLAEWRRLKLKNRKPPLGIDLLNSQLFKDMAQEQQDSIVSIMTAMASGGRKKGKDQ